MAYSDTIRLVANDTQPVLTFTLTDASTGAAVNLTGAVVRMRIRDLNTTTEKAALVCAMVNPAAGQVATNFPTGTLDTAGTFEAEIEIVFADTSIQTVYDLIKLVVRDDIG
jgi:hypothetical protein